MHPSNKEVLLGLFSKQEDLTVTIIPTAWDTYSPERKTAEVRAQIAAFEQWGFKASVIELTSISGTTLKENLTGKDLVWVTGGNTFYLNYFMLKSGFSDVIRKFLDDGMVYGGESAGAVVAGSTFKGIDCVDDPNEAPGIVWEGLGLVSKGVLPHWGWEKYETEMKAAKESMSKTTEVITIDNDRALVIEDGKERVVENPTDV